MDAMTVSTTSLTSITSLPNEALAAIFESGKEKGGWRKGLPFEVTVSHVCGYWRQVALSAPCLWSEIDAQAHRKLEYVFVYLERSKAAPLDIRLDFTDIDSQWRPDSLVECMVDLFLPHAERWRSFAIKTYREETACVVLYHLKRLAVPILRRLSTSLEERVEDFENVGTWETLPIFQGGAPLLSYLRVDTSHCFWPPLVNLTTLHLYRAWGGSIRLTYDEFLQIITAPSSLIHLIIEGIVGEVATSPTDDLPQIELPHLRSLRLFHPMPHISNLLLALSAPKLESLWFENLEDGDVHAFLQFQVPRFPSLRYLTFHATHPHPRQLSEATYRALFRVLPSITHLNMTHCYRQDLAIRKVLGVIDATRSASVSRINPPWPNLHTIAIRSKYASNEPWTRALCDILSNMLHAREAVGRPVQKLLLDQGLIAQLPADGLEQLRKQVDTEWLCSSNYAEPLWVMDQDGGW